MHRTRFAVGRGFMAVALFVTVVACGPALAQQPEPSLLSPSSGPATAAAPWQPGAAYRLPPVATAAAPLSPPGSTPLLSPPPHDAMRPFVVPPFSGTLPAPSSGVTTASYQQGGPVLDPDVPGDLDARLGTGDTVQGDAQTFVSPRSSPVLDPNQVGNLDLRLDESERRLEAAGGAKKDALPLIRLSGFMQLDQGFFSQSAASQAQLGDIQNGFGFRRTRLQAIGKLTDFTGYSIEMDFATIGRPSFMDVWGEQSELPILGTLRIGQFRQPGTMDAWTSIRHLEFLERSLPFQALDPFRRVGVMAYSMSENERTTWAYSVYGTGLTFFNGTGTTYSTLGDTRAGTQIGDSGGVAFASRLTHLLYYDDLSDGRYLLHVGAGYDFSEVGGEGTTGTFAKTYTSRPIPEFFVGDPAAGGLTAGGTPVVVDTGRILARNFHFYHLELAGNYGPAHFQTEVMCTSVNQMNGGSMINYPGAYVQCGYFLTGESCLYLKQAGVLDYNVVPYSDFFGVGRNKWMIGGWGAWEAAFRWSWLDMTGSNILPVNQLSNSAGPPPAPNPGVVNETTVALNWWWNKFTRVQFNWIRSMPRYANVGSAPFDIYGARFQIEF